MQFTISPAFAVGTPLIFTGLYALRDPLASYRLFGVPSPSPRSSTTNTKSNNVSPFVYAKAVRDLALGLTGIGLHIYGDQAGVTALLAATVFTGLGDGWVVWCCGGELKQKAWEHWIPTVVILAPLVVKRMRK